MHTTINNRIITRDDNHSNGFDRSFIVAVRNGIDHNDLLPSFRISAHSPVDGSQPFYVCEAGYTSNHTPNHFLPIAIKRYHYGAHNFRYPELDTNPTLSYASHCDDSGDGELHFNILLLGTVAYAHATGHFRYASLKRAALDIIEHLSPVTVRTAFFELHDRSGRFYDNTSRRMPEFDIIGTVMLTRDDI